MVEGGWNIADAVSRSYDLEGMQVGTVGAGRIGSAVLRRLKAAQMAELRSARRQLFLREVREAEADCAAGDASSFDDIEELLASLRD